MTHLCGCLELVRLVSHQSVCVHEHTLAVVCEGPAVEFGEGDTQVGTLHERQMSRIARVHDVHHANLIENALQCFPGRQTAVI